MVAVGLAAAGLTAAVLCLLRADRPLLDLRILRIATYRVTAVGGSVFRAVISAIPFLLPAVLPARVRVDRGAGGPGGDRAVPRQRRDQARDHAAHASLRDPRGGCSGCLAAAACLVGIAFVTAATPLPLLLALLAASGAFRSVGFTAYNSVAFADVEPARMTPANTLISTLRSSGRARGRRRGAARAPRRLLWGGRRPRRGADEPFRVAFVLLAVLLAVAWRACCWRGRQATP